MKIFASSYVVGERKKSPTPLSNSLIKLRGNETLTQKSAMILSLLPSVSPSQALKAHAIVSMLFCLPVVLSGAGGFLELVTEGAIKSAQLTTGKVAAMLLHITYIDCVKNMYISAICWTAATKMRVADQKLVCKINVLMMIGAVLCLKYSPPVGGGPLLPPPALAYFSVMGVFYCLALQVPKTIAKMMPSLPKIGGSSAAAAPSKKATPSRRTPSRRR